MPAGPVPGSGTRATRRVGHEQAGHRHRRDGRRRRVPPGDPALRRRRRRPRPPRSPPQKPATQKAAPAAKPVAPAELDRLLAPVALYPDQLLGQILLCSQNPGKVGALAEWLAGQSLKGSALQDAAVKSGFEPHFVALVVFPDVVNAMASSLDRTTQVGQAFTADRSAVFASVQRLRTKAQNVGTLKTPRSRTSRPRRRRRAR